MGNNQREVQSSHSTNEPMVTEESENNAIATNDEEKEKRLRRARKGKQLAIDFTVEILEFEGQHNSYYFLQ